MYKIYLIRATGLASAIVYSNIDLVRSDCECDWASCEFCAGDH